MIVAHSRSKSGNVVNRRYVEIVVVQTNAGYEPVPSGTGTIVATFCTGP